MSKKNNINTPTDDEIRRFVEHVKSPDTSLDDEKLNTLKKQVSESLSVMRNNLLLRMPFTGGMLMRMDMIPVRDYRISTACTDGQRIYVDINFYKNLNDKERLFVLAHECWHNIYLHFARCHNRNRQAWNIATDCEINYMLNKNNFTMPENLCYPDGREGCPPSSYEGKSAEEMYEYVIKKAKKQGFSNSSDDSDSSGSGSNSSKDGKNTGKLTGQFDKHITDEGENNGVSKNGVPTDEWGEKGEDPDYNPRIDRDAAEKIREGIISEAQKIERTQGKLPGSLEDYIKKLRNPEINWKEVLANYVTTHIGGDNRTWLPPNRRHVWHDLYLQSHRGENINVSVIVDTSGSTTADLPKFMSELVSLLNTFGNYNLMLIQCDAEVQNVEMYDECNPFPLDDCSMVQWKGFGGSDLNPAFEYMEDEMFEPSINIVFTDGYIDVPKKNPLTIPSLFVLTSDGNEKLCDWGIVTKFKDKTDDQ